VMKVAIDGGTPTLLGARPSAAAEIAVDAANVYWSDLAGEIVKAGIAGGTDPVVLAKMDAAPDSIAIDATYIYWVNSFGYALARVSLAGGGQPEQVWPGGIATCAGTTAWTRTVAVDATGIYWTDLAGNVFAALPGQPARARVVANMGSSGLRGAADIVLDSTTVYWMNSLGVFRAAR